MTAAYPAASTYTSSAYASSPRAAAPASRGWFNRKPHTSSAAPLAAGAATAAATAPAAHTNGRDTSAAAAPVTNGQSAVGPVEDASRTTGQTAAPASQYGAFTQHNGVQSSNSGLAQEQPMQGNLGYAREAEMVPAGPAGVSAAHGEADHSSHNVLNNGNRAGFFQAA